MSLQAFENGIGLMDFFEIEQDVAEEREVHTAAA